jgi:hypothetical protein
MKQVKTFIPMPVYGYRIYVIFTDDLEACAEQLKKDGLLAQDFDSSDTGAFTLKYTDKFYTYLVYPVNAPSGTIVHEVYHAVCNMFNWINAKPCEETVAYTLGYVTREVIHDQAAALKKFNKILDKAETIKV